MHWPMVDDDGEDLIEGDRGWWEGDRSGGKDAHNALAVIAERSLIWCPKAEEKVLCIIIV